MLASSSQTAFFDSDHLVNSILRFQSTETVEVNCFTSLRMQFFRQFYQFRQIYTIALFITHMFDKQKGYADVSKHALCVS